MTFDKEGRLTICQHGNRRVIRVEPHGNITVLADAHDGKRLNSPNDLVYRSDGTLYFTDPPFGLPEAFDDAKKKLPFSGVYRVREGLVELLSGELEGPNGIAFSPDDRYLYVGNWDPKRKIVMRYELDDAGDVIDASVLFDMTGAEGEDAVDGLKVDLEGNLYVCRRVSGCSLPREITWARSSSPNPRTTLRGATRTARRSTSPHSRASTGWSSRSPACARAQ